MITKTHSQFAQAFPCYSYGGWYYGEPKTKVTGQDLLLYRNGTITSESGRQKENYCLHSVDYSDPVPESGEFFQLTHVEGMTGGVTRIVEGFSKAEVVKNWTAVWGPFVGMPTAIQINSMAGHRDFVSWASDRLEFHQTAVRADMDLPVAIWEFRDLKRLVSSAGSIGRAIERIRQSPRKVRELFSRRPIGALVSTYLGQIYGLRPLMKDIDALTKGLQGGWESGFARFQSNLNKPVHVHSSYENMWFGEEVQSGARSYIPASHATYRFNATRRVRCDGSALSYNDYLRRKMGFGTPLVSLWNAIPFSFVADWFLNVGKAIEQASQLSDKLRVTLTKVSCSRKFVSDRFQYFRIRSGYYLVNGNVAWNGTYYPPVMVGTLHSRSYERFPGVPAYAPIRAEHSWRTQLAPAVALGIAQILQRLPTVNPGPRQGRSWVERSAVQIPRGWDAWRGV